MFRLVLRRGYRIQTGSPCAGYRVPKVHPIKAPSAEHVANQIQNANLLRLVTAYRTHGHKSADLDPLGFHSRDRTELALEKYGFSRSSTQTYNTDGLLLVVRYDVAVC